MTQGRSRIFAFVTILLASKLTLAAPAAATQDTEDDEVEAAPSPAKQKKAPPPEKASDADAAPAEGAPPPAPVKPDLPSVRNRWETTLYGFIELDGIHDSTQSYNDGANGNNLARRGTYAGDRGQTQATIKNSRLGLKIHAPDWGSIRSSGAIEMDFFGLQPLDSTQNDYYVLANLRLRHAYFKLETPVVDVLAGQYHDLFGWGGNGFYPNTVAFLGVPGEIYHRNPQLRLSKSVGSTVSFDVALAAVRPAQRHSEAPDVQAGLKLAFNNWVGVTSQGASQPQSTPMAIAVSAIGRRFVLPQFIGQPRNSITQYGGGGAVDVVIPVVPASNVHHRANALTITGEASIGTGIADMYSGMTGGGKFPLLSNPGGDNPPFLYPQDVDAGLITFDAEGRAKTYNWSAFFVGAQYYLPIADGNVWISGIYSQAKSNNMWRLTPAGSWGAVFSDVRYADGNLFFAVGPAVQLGFSFQWTQQTYVDGSKPVNLRTEGSATFFF
jgi:hypothetical protein